MDNAALTADLLGLIEFPETPDGSVSGEGEHDATVRFDEIRIDPGDFC